ncbi:MAG: mercuric transporter MerT family protein [Candidatus Bathyarchaeia archaeon]
MKDKKKKLTKENQQKNSGKAGAIGIGVASGIVASLCCLGPAFIVLLGLSSLSAALTLTQFQPYFLALSIISMAGAVWVYLRKKNQGHCDLHVVRRNKSFITVVVIVMVLFYVTALYVVMPVVTPYIYGTVDGNTFPQNSTSLHQVTLRIQGMTCPSCADAIESLLKQKEGVVGASVDYFQGTGEVIYDSAKVTTEEIVNTIQPYTATVIEDKELE